VCSMRWPMCRRAPPGLHKHGPPLQRCELPTANLSPAPVRPGVSPTHMGWGGSASAGAGGFPGHRRLRTWALHAARPQHAHRQQVPPSQYDLPDCTAPQRRLPRALCVSVVQRQDSAQGARPPSRRDYCPAGNGACASLSSFHFGSRRLTYGTHAISDLWEDDGCAVSYRLTFCKTRSARCSSSRCYAAWTTQQRNVASLRRRAC
jgi:hypothetical protein